MTGAPIRSASPASPERSRHALDTGTLTLEITRAASPALFRIAERQNPKRAFLFVSTVLGRHIPVAPHRHRDALKRLAVAITDTLGDGPVLVMSYAETAIGLGLGVFEELRRLRPARPAGYLPTTRFRPRGERPWFETREDHSHAVDHMIFAPDAGVLARGRPVSLVLVDDETTTGNTFAGLAAGLADRLDAVGVAVDRIVLATLTDWSDGCAAAAVEAVFRDATVRAVSLLAGRYRWDPDPDRSPRALPAGCAPACPAWAPDPAQDWARDWAKQPARDLVSDAAQPPRTGFGVPRKGLAGDALESGRAAWQAHVRRQVLPRLGPDGSVLVIGTGEHVWHPFLAAEMIAAAGRETGFIATTRSPVAPGPVIDRQIRFPDHWGIGLTMYLNNVDPDAWDEIVLFTETGAAGIPQALRAALGKGWICAADGTGPMLGGLA